MASDLGERIWFNTGFYLRGLDAERFRAEAKIRGREDDLDGLLEDLVSEALSMYHHKRE